MSRRKIKHPLRETVEALLLTLDGQRGGNSIVAVASGL